jgi:ABC-2 type transport system ATP-binding protein
LIGEVASLLEQVLIIDHGKLLLDGQVESVLARSHLITGPTRQAAEYVAGLNVIGQEKLGKISSYYIYDDLDDSRPLPDTVSIEQLDLQQLFINLTNRRKDGK